MKKTLAILTLFAALVLVFSACKKETSDSFGNIAGTVIDNAMGNPVQRAVVTLNPTSLQVFTGSNGQFEMQEVEPGRYTARVTCNGYQANSLIVNVIAGETTRADFVLYPEQ